MTTPDTEERKCEACGRHLYPDAIRLCGHCLENGVPPKKHTPDTEWTEVQVGDRVICDGLSTGKTGKVLGVGSSEHSIKLLIDGKMVCDENCPAITHRSSTSPETPTEEWDDKPGVIELIEEAISSRDTYWKERVGKAGIQEAIELLTSAHVSTDLVWKRYDTVEKLKALDTLLDNLK